MQAVAKKSLFRDVGVGARNSLLLFCAATIPAAAQSTASLSGVLTDPAGAALATAKVAATNRATAVSSTTQSDRAGAYLFPSLPIGVPTGDFGSSRQMQFAMKLIF